MDTRMFLFAVVLALLAPPAASGATLSCDGGIVSTGDRSADLIVKCGKPDWKESRFEEVVDKSDPNVRRKTSVSVEEWTYDLGPQQFMRIVELKNGVITDIRTGQYGTRRPRETEASDCGDRIISVGDRKADVLLKCGEPAHRESRTEETRDRTDAGREVRTTIVVETWTYDLGPNRFTRIITMRNGVVSDVTTGGYGK